MCWNHYIVYYILMYSKVLFVCLQVCLSRMVMESPRYSTAPSKFEMFFAVFSRKTRVLRRKSHREAIWNEIFASYRTRPR